MVKKLRRLKEKIIGMIAIMGSIYLLMSMLTHYIRDPVLFFRITQPSEPVHNIGGIVGAYISGWLFIFLGFSAYLIPLLLIVYGVKRLKGRQGHYIHLLGGILFVVSSSLFLSLFSLTFNIQVEGYPDGIGGLTGRAIAYISYSLLSLPGSFIFSLSLFLSSLIILSPVSVGIAFKRKTQKNPIVAEKIEKDKEEQEILIKEPEPVFIPKSTIRKEIESNMPKRVAGYEIPSLDLLSMPESILSRPSKDELLSDSSIIEKKLEDFGIDGRIIQVHPGPIITMYEFEPAPGVKINRIVSLADDLALSLKAQSVRIAPIPGRAVIGIEVPNKQRETVFLREILSSEGFKKSKSKLTLGLGKDIYGNPVILDLSKMPHLLVAGATGSGKSVSINSMVISILYKATPADVKMLMIDPKLLELSAYEGIPHLISPVITTPKEAAEALKKMVIEMERRYRIIAEKSSRNIESYNLQVKEEMMPYIIIIIDELADLMFTAPNDVEDSIARLAQMGRASGIHLILATQRPSVDVITGIIKANFSARISFQVSSKVDSRTILDTHGAEQLLGKGDMLLMLPGARIMRVHGAFINEHEISSVSEFVKSQCRPDYTIFENIHGSEALPREEAETERDEMYLKAVELGEAMGEVSISSIQRRLKIGYNRAARIMELMEEDGLVGPPKGAGKPRDFLRKRLIK